MMMVERRRLRRIGVLALPIVGGMVSQNIFNLVDTAMVGVLGDVALAAVGMGSFANFMAVAILMGLSAGVQAMASRRVGEGRRAESAIPLNGGLILGVVVGLPWCMLLIWFAPDAFALLMPDPAVRAEGVPYLEARLLGVVGLALNFAFRGHWNGVDMSRIYMGTLVVMHLANVVLNYLLIFGKFGLPEMGTEGAGLASAISTWVGTGVYVLLAFRHARPHGFLAALPDRRTFVTLLRLCVPAGIQQFFFAAGFTTLFWIVGQVGTQEVAAATVMINLSLVAILPGLGLGLASATLVGQAMGREELDDAHQWAWDVVKVGVVAMGLVGLSFVLFPELMLAPFLYDPETLEVARLPLQIAGAGIGLDAVGLVLQHSLLGAGASRTVMIIAISLQWGVGLPLAYMAGVVWEWGLVGIWCAQVGHRAVQAGALAVAWNRRSWTKIKV